MYSLNCIFIFYHNIYIIQLLGTCFNFRYKYNVHVFKIYSTFIIWGTATGRILNLRLLFFPYSNVLIVQIIIFHILNNKKKKLLLYLKLVI